MLWFSRHFPENIEGAYTPHDFPVGQEHSVSPHKVLWDLFLKAFHDKWRRKFLANLLRGREGRLYWCTTWEINDYFMPSRESFTNVFSRNLKTVNPKFFANH